MFLGWQLTNDFDELVKLKKGVLEIDVKSGKCECDGNENSKLTMPLVLNDWLVSDLNEHSINLSEIDSAKLRVKFNMHDFGLKKNGVPPEFVCNSILVSGGNTYSLEYIGESSQNEIEIT